MTENETPTKAQNGGGVENLVQLLRDRDVNRPELLTQLAAPDAILGAVRWYDEQRKRSDIGAGVLVNCIREGGKPGYDGNRSQAKPIPTVTPKLLNAVRGRCLSPDGCRRVEVLDMFGDAAGHRGLDADALIDQAVGPRWQLTPPHPALLLEDGKLTGRYSHWVGGERDKPDPTVIREPGESLLAYSSRFWRWQHP